MIIPRFATLIALMASSSLMASTGAAQSAGSTTTIRPRAPVRAVPASALPHLPGPGTGPGAAGSGAGSTPTGDPHDHGPVPAAGRRNPAPTGRAGGVLQLASFELDVPAPWRQEPPRSSMRAAQLRVPGTGGAADGEMSVYYFGPDAGGVEANIERWYGQIEQPDGRATAEVARRESFDAGGMKVTIIDVAGILQGSGMPGMGPAAPQAGSRMLAAIVEAKDGPWFFKGTGPDATMAPARDAFEAMLRSARPATAPPAGPAPGTATPPGPSADPAAAGGPAAGSMSAGSGSTGGGSDAEPAGRLGGTLELPDFTLEVPATWRQVPPQSSMRQAQLVIPAAGGESAAEMSVYYFGPEAGGVEANIERWYGQMEQPDGRPSSEVARRESFDVAGMRTTVIDVTGTLAASGMGMGPATPRPGSRMLAAIIEAKSGPWFFKGTGPDRTMDRARSDFRAMLESARPR